MITLRRRLERRFEYLRGNDRGLAIVEMAIVAPLLALLVAGIMEYGLLWRDDLTVTSATRAGARVASNLGDSYLSDYEALVSLDAALASIDGITIEGVLIYHADAADGTPHSSCFDVSGDPQSSNNECNFYSAADLITVAALDCSVSCTEFPDNGNCFGGMSVNFCPQQDRETDQATGVTDVGVWVRINREYTTGIFPGEGVTITDYTVMTVEPTS